MACRFLLLDECFALFLGAANVFNVMISFLSMFSFVARFKRFRLSISHRDKCACVEVVVSKQARREINKVFHKKIAIRCMIVNSI